MSDADTTPPAGSDPLLSTLLKHTEAIDKFAEAVEANARASAALITIFGEHEGKEQGMHAETMAMLREAATARKHQEQTIAIVLSEVRKIATRVTEAEDMIGKLQTLALVAQVKKQPNGSDDGQ